MWRTAGRGLRLLGWGVLGLGFAVVVVGYASTVYYQGWDRLLYLLSPFNLVNWLLVLLTLAPGLLLLAAGAALLRRVE